MELLNPMKPFMAVYSVFDKMKLNKDQNPHILSRLEALQELVVFVENKEPHQLSKNVQEALKKLAIILVSAKEILDGFEKMNMMVHVVKASDYKSEFEQLNKSLTDAFVTLSSALHIHQEKTLDEQEKKLMEQRNGLTKQDNQLHEQQKKLARQEKMLVEQEKELAEQRQNLDEQDGKLEDQEKNLARQEKMLKEQEDLLLQLESRVMNESRAFYCVLL